MSRAVLSIVVPLLVIRAAAPVIGAAPSSSKIGIHLIQNNTPGITQICNAHPRVIKILDVHGPMIDAARNYKAGTPNGIVVLRVYTPKHYDASVSPAAAATDFMNTVLAPALNSLSAADRALIDYVEGPNECDSTVCWGSLQDAQWFNAFWVSLAPLIANAGHKPCAFSIPVGNPPGTIGEMQEKLAAVVPALRLCKQLGGAWSYHAYTPAWSTDSNLQIWYALRYRQFYSYFAQSFPDLVDLPLILTEAGFDTGGSPTGSGWQANGTAQQYQDWLTWWDDQIVRDDYVLGSTLFQIGTPGWPSFEVEPIAGWLADYLIAHSTPKLTCSPASLQREIEVGGQAVAASFTVTNTGSKTMDYTIADNAAWMSANPTAGTSSGESDVIGVGFLTSGLAAGVYTGKITVTAPGADNSPQEIAVTLTVRPRPIPGDLDGDRSVDGDDVVRFAACMTGADSGPPAPSCTAADLDDDGDIDQADFGILQNCISGDGLIGDPDCASR